jgi:hypothetical protein
LRLQATRSGGDSLTASDPEATTASAGRSLGRRVFLKCLAGLSLLLAVPSSLRAFFIRTFPVRTVEQDTFLFEPDTGMIYWKNQKTRDPYYLIVDGLVEKPLRLSYSDLTSLPRVTQLSDFHCVEGWSVADVPWGGIRFKEIMTRVKPKAGAKYAVFHALGTTSSGAEPQDHYTECFPVAELTDPKKDCLLALTHEGKPLSHNHGAPCRVVSPRDLAYKNIKYVTRIEFTREQVAGWWTRANPVYPIDAPVPEERLRKK